PRPAMTAAGAKPISFFHAVDWSIVFSKDHGRDINVEKMCDVGALLIEFFDLLGFAFKPVRNDVAGNLKKIRNSFEAEPNERRTIGELLQRESDTKADKKDPSGTIGLLWFKRALEYIYKLLTLIYESRDRVEDFGTSELSVKAYDCTLRHRHGWFMRKTFNLVSSASPYRSKLIEKLAYGNVELPHSQIYAAMEPFLDGMRSFVENMDSLLISFGVETPIGAATAEAAADEDAAAADTAAA
ncbi:hypothetical protein BOX15_Mlig014058g2, partial [Macrostomum lignano]